MNYCKCFFIGVSFYFAAFCSAINSDLVPLLQKKVASEKYLTLEKNLKCLHEEIEKKGKAVDSFFRECWFRNLCGALRKYFSEKNWGKKVAGEGRIRKLFSSSSVGDSIYCDYDSEVENIFCDPNGCKRIMNIFEKGVFHNFSIIDSLDLIHLIIKLKERSGILDFNKLNDSDISRFCEYLIGAMRMIVVKSEDWCKFDEDDIPKNASREGMNEIKKALCNYTRGKDDLLNLPAKTLITLIRTMFPKGMFHQFSSYECQLMMRLTTSDTVSCSDRHFFAECLEGCLRCWCLLKNFYVDRQIEGAGSMLIIDGVLFGKKRIKSYAKDFVLYFFNYKQWIKKNCTEEVDVDAKIQSAEAFLDDSSFAIAKDVFSEESKENFLIIPRELGGGNDVSIKVSDEQWKILNGFVLGVLPWLQGRTIFCESREIVEFIEQNYRNYNAIYKALLSWSGIPDKFIKLSNKFE